MKTKVLVLGSQTKVNIDFNGKAIEQVESYKYLGNIVNTVHSYKADAFSKNYEYKFKRTKQEGHVQYLKTLKIVGTAPSSETNTPIWESCASYPAVRQRCLGCKCIYWYDNWQAFLPLYALCSNVKSTTSNAIVVGECGQMPPITCCQINALSYLKILQDLPDTKIVKQVFNELNRLHLCGVRTWVTEACELAEKYGIDIDSSNQNFKKHCKLVISDWYTRN